MTSFWNFIALGHSPQLVIEKKNFSHILPGFRLFLMEPPSESHQSLIGTEINDVRSHLTQIFYRYSLPFQKVVIHQPRTEPPTSPIATEPPVDPDVGDYQDYQEE
jgi:hypothetical protein